MLQNIFKPIAIVGCWLILSNCSNEAKNSTKVATTKAVLEVKAVVAQYSSLDNAYSYTGNLLANEEVELRPEISAKVTGIFFQEGKKVIKGQRLVKMYDADLQAQLRKIKLQIELAEKELSRKKELFELKGISSEEYEISENKLNSLKADQELLNAQISKTELIAPFSGIVGLRKVSEGAFVSNTTVITSIQQIDPIKVEFSVPEKFISNLNMGKEVDFTIDKDDQIYKAKIFALESKIDAATRSIKIRALCPNRQSKLVPGSFANININYTPDKQTIVIPAKAIFPVIKGEQVFIIKNGKAKAVDVKVGIRDGNSVEIVDGVAPNDTIVITGLLQIKDGVAVKAKIESR